MKDRGLGLVSHIFLVNLCQITNVWPLFICLVDCYDCPPPPPPPRKQNFGSNWKPFKPQAHGLTACHSVFASLGFRPVCCVPLEASLIPRLLDHGDKRVGARANFSRRQKEKHRDRRQKLSRHSLPAPRADITFRAPFILRHSFSLHSDG